MQPIVVKGGKRLFGRLPISGSKNAALPIIAAALMANKDIKLHNIPNIADVCSMIKIAKHVGFRASYKKCTLHLMPEDKQQTDLAAIADTIGALRASVLVIGAMLALHGHVTIPMPGGCMIGKRPIDMHLSALKQMGAEIQYGNFCIHLHTKHGLCGTRIEFPKISVGATENIIIAATLAEGTTEICNAAMEPEITDLANFLNKLGANITGAGTPNITIKGTKGLRSSEYTIIYDRIEAVSYALAAIITGGEIELVGKNLIQQAVLEKIKETGATVKQSENSLTVGMCQSCYSIKPVKISTMPYPHFPSDAQPQFTAMLALATGQSLVEENIYENRFLHVKELQKMGAQISPIDHNTISICGVKALNAAIVSATDLRSAMSLVIAALAANGETVIRNSFHIDRGYESLVAKLSQCGANIKRPTTEIA